MAPLLLSILFGALIAPILSSTITWKVSGNWKTSTTCDFVGQGDFKSVASSAASGCAAICDANAPCTFYAWAGGTCYLKQGAIPAAAYSTTAACGYKVAWTVSYSKPTIPTTGSFTVSTAYTALESGAIITIDVLDNTNWSKWGTGSAKVNAGTGTVNIVVTLYGGMSCSNKVLNAWVVTAADSTKSEPWNLAKVTAQAPVSCAASPPTPAPPPASSCKSAKRGVAYGFTNAADLKALSSLSWYYNWDYKEGISSTSHAGVEYVPMIWGKGTLDLGVQTVANAIPSGAKYLLGFNEPNFFAQSNLSPAEAASLWPKVEQIAALKNLKIVSPATNYCGPASSCWNTDPVAYMDAFFAACKNNPSGGCKVDAIAVHFYVCELDWLTPKIELFYKYNLPIWLTEFAAGDCTGQTSQSQAAYIAAALPWLEGNAKIQRYAWFSGRATNVQAASLLAGTGVLINPSGTTYNSVGIAASCSSSAASTATEISESSGEETNASEDVPAWAAGVLALAGLMVVGLVVALAILLFKKNPTERP